MTGPFARPIGDLEAALRLRSAAETAAFARWQDAEQRRYREVTARVLDDEHRRFLHELAYLDAAVAAALQLLDR